MQFHSTLDWHHVSFFCQKIHFNHWGREYTLSSITLFRRRRKGKGGRGRGVAGDRNQESDSSWEGSQHSFVPLEDKSNFGELELDFSSSHVTTRHPQTDSPELRHNWRGSGAENNIYPLTLTYHLMLIISHLIMLSL